MQHPNIDYKERYEMAEQTISQLKHELAILKKMIFGSRHEKFVSTEASVQQLSLDMKADQTATSSVISVQRISYTRKKINTEPVPHPGRNKLPDHLRREEIVIDPIDLPQGSKRIGQLRQRFWNTRPQNYMLNDTSGPITWHRNLMQRTPPR